MSKTILYKNGIIFTGRSKTDAYHNMVVQNGRVKKLVNDELNEMLFDETVDLEGKYVFPCFIDPHVHLLMTVAAHALGFEICKIKGNQVVPFTMAGIEDSLREFASTKKKNQTIVANNYIPSAIDERRLPTKDELDDWCEGRPVAIYTMDGHASALSTKMLEKIGIDPEGHNGILQGEDHDRNLGKLTDAVASAITPKAIAKGLAKVENMCAAKGVSHIGALDGNGDSPKDLTTHLIVHLARHMKVKVRMYFQYFNVERAEKFQKYQKRPRIGGCGEWEMDGASGAHSASFSVPYKDTKETAPCYYTQEEVDKIVMEADSKGYQIASHAIGDNAIRMLASALMKTKSDVFHRLEHGEFPTEDTMEAYKSGKFAVVMQPGYSWVDKRFLHSYEQVLSQDVIERLKFKSWYDAGICVCGSSDSPVQAIDQFQQMLGMVQYYIPSESVTMYEAFRCCTINAAKAMNEAHNIGSLEVGKEANFFISDRNLFELKPEELSEFMPLETYYDGELYEEKKGTLGELIKMMFTKAHKI